MKVGSLVELVDDNWDDESKRLNELCGVTYPIKNKIYTVRDIENGVMLEEIINPRRDYADGFGEISFRNDRFRELQPPMSIALEAI